MNRIRTLGVLILYTSTFFLQDKVVWVRLLCYFLPNTNSTVCAWRRHLKTVSYVHRMNVDELELQQHERGFVTMCLTHRHFIFCHWLGPIKWLGLVPPLPAATLEWWTHWCTTNCSAVVLYSVYDSGVGHSARWVLLLSVLYVLVLMVVFCFGGFCAFAQVRFWMQDFSL